MLAACAAPARAADPERDAFEAPPEATAPVPSGVTEARDDLREDLGRQALLTVDAETGAVSFLARLDGYLTTTPSDSPAATVRDYLSRRAQAFGVSSSDISDLELSHRATADGIESLEFTQMVDGVPVVDSSVQAHLDDEGRLIAITGGLVPDAGLDTDPDVSREDAQAAAARGVASPDATDTPALVAYTSGNDLRLAWRVIVGASSTAWYDTLVDAASGRVVRRNNLVKFGSATVFDNYPGADTGGTATSQDLSGPGYHTSGEQRLIGPNVHAFTDPDDEVPGDDLNNPVLNPPDGETPPTSGSDFAYGFDPWTPTLGTQYGEDCQDPDFVCSWNPKDFGDWTFDSGQAATQLFWYVNVFHDHLEAPPIGFNAGSGNFEGSDRIVAQAQDGADTGNGFPDPGHSNNANMLVLPDGKPGFMQMYLWDPVSRSTSRPVHGGDDPSLVFHEYAHGLTGRLVTDPLGYGALNGAQSGAIDEGTADWYALDYLVEEGLFPDDEDAPDVTMAPYEVVGPTGLRTQAIDCPVGAVSAQCPNNDGGAGPGGYTYADFAKVSGGAEEHADGEIWAQTLWQLRRRLVAVHGQSNGLDRVRRLVTGALRLAPTNPSFLDMRNAILLADVQANLGDRASIWDVFKQRGMGYAASTRGTDDVAPLPDFTGPPVGPFGVGSMSGTVRDLDTGARIPNVLVAFSGHDSGLGEEDLAAHTAGDGTYRIDGIPARLWDYVAVAPPNGYDRVLAEDIPIFAGRVYGRNFTLRRNWALSSGGTAVRSFTGTNFGLFGCGPAGAIDGSSRTVWSTRAPSNPDEPGAKELVITLPQAITLGEVRINPTAGCGDTASAGLGGYQVQVSSNASTWSTVAQGTFTSANNGRANAVALGSQPAGVRFVKLRALSTQGGVEYIDVAELQVYAKSSVAPPPPPPTPTPTPPPPTVTKLKLLTHTSRIGRRRAFAFRVKGPRGVRGDARFTIVIGRGSAARRVTFAKARFRLSARDGRARVVAKVSSRTLRRIRAQRIRVAVTIRADGQKVTSRVTLKRPKPVKKKRRGR